MIVAGIDVGSSAVKAALVGCESGAAPRLIGTARWRIRRRPVTEVAAAAFDELLARHHVARAGVTHVTGTGHADAAPFCDARFTSVTCHALGAAHLQPGLGTVVDLGALELRCARIDERGRVLQHRITGQCASGAGQFVEHLVRYLGLTVEEVGPLSLTAARGERVSSVCAVLAETDVVNMVARGVPIPEILRGVHDAVAERVLKVIRGAGAMGSQAIALTGGLAADVGLQAAVAALLPPGGQVLVVPPHAAFAGAIGAALCAAGMRKGQDSRMLGT